jgi:pimeloyl-ACP methyl ester carboxylesterase
MKGKAVEAPRTTSFGPARIVALALLCIAALGLAYLHFGTGHDPAGVPSGAQAGQLKLHPCQYATENGNYRADCGTLVVPENRHQAHSRLIALPVIRILARSARPAAPVFRLEGGPGLTNLDFPDASRFAGHHDVVLVGYRGVDGSSKLDCPEVSSAREHARDFLTEQAMRADAAAFRACAQRLQRDGVDLAGYTLPERVDDLDAARQALGYQRVDLLSESAGTRTALIYAWRYPTRITRSVLIDVNPPGDFLWDAGTTGEQVRRYAALCAQDSSCRSRTPDLTASLRLAYAHIPSRFWFLPVKRGVAQTTAFWGLMQATSAAEPLSAPMTIDTLLSAGHGDGSGSWFLSLMGQLAFPKAQIWGDVAAVGRSDAAYAQRFFAARADRGSAIGAPGTDFVWAGGKVLSSWPASPDENQYTRVPDSTVETLMIGGNLDFATPPQNATRALLPHLPNGHQVILTDLGHTDDFWASEPAASQHLVSTFFDTGRVDTSRYTTNRVDFTPGMTQGTIAKIAVGAMLGLAALTVLLLLWLPLRLRRRGSLGRTASGAIRSASPLLFGLGGWLLGALVALTALPTVPITDELLVSLSAGLPTGLGIYYAWANRAWSVRTRAIGLAAAAGGALVGAWLGFHATSGLYAPLLAIAGAAIGANLTVLALDIAWDRQLRDRFAAGTAPAPEALASSSPA